MAWPTIQDPSGVVEKLIKAQLKSKFESGKVISRSKHTRARHIFELSWKALHEDEYDLLKIAFNSDIGTTFSWFHPRREISYNVRYKDDSIEAQFVYPCYYSLTIGLEEE